MIKKRTGFTFVELLISTVLLASLFTGVMLTILKSMELSELTNNSSLAVLAAQNKLAEIENTAFNQVFANYNNATFNPNGLNGKGVTYVDNAIPKVLSITVVVCFKQANGRLLGEDSNLNGQLDAGEDKDGDGKLDSIIQFTTAKYDL